MQARFRHGSPLMVDYTPSEAVSAGQVVVIGHKPYIAHVDIAADEKGAVAAHGGVYEMLVDGNFGPGENVFWDDATNKLSQGSSTSPEVHFGFLTPDSNPSANGDTVYVEHLPNGFTTAD